MRCLRRWPTICPHPGRQAHARPGCAEGLPTAGQACATQAASPSQRHQWNARKDELAGQTQTGQQQGLQGTGPRGTGLRTGWQGEGTGLSQQPGRAAPVPGSHRLVSPGAGRAGSATQRRLGHLALGSLLRSRLGPPAGAWQTGQDASRSCFQTRAEHTPWSVPASRPQMPPRLLPLSPLSASASGVNPIQSGPGSPWWATLRDPCGFWAAV